MPAWIDHYGDLDQDGFVEYSTESLGLTHQGWKDSFDSVFHADGSLAKGPIALCEVQAYVFAAKKGMEMVAQRLGKLDIAQRLANEADGLRASFQQAFWCDEIGMYALALDGQKQQCKVRSSNVSLAALLIQNQSVALSTNSASIPFFQVGESGRLPVPR